LNLVGGVPCVPPYDSMDAQIDSKQRLMRKRAVTW